MSQLVLSLFPGIGLLDMAFEEEGFCVVRGPDLLWGGDIRRFHPPAGKFDGVIGGPPCQAFSRFRFLNPNAGKHGNLIPEFERVVVEARPTWFVMENVPGAPEPVVKGYEVRDTLLNNRWLGEEQHRLRRFSFGTASGAVLHIEQAALESPLWAPAISSSTNDCPVALIRDGKGGHKTKKRRRAPTVIASDTFGPGYRGKGNYMTWQEKVRLQGLPSGFDLPPFLVSAKHEAIGNGVPLPMGRAVAKAVKCALGIELPSIRASEEG